jgi:hypothetical protein
VAFLVGFITVLCIGNYFRAKRAQERQKQRRDAKMATSSSSTANNNNNNNLSSTIPGSMLGGGSGKGVGAVDYEAPVLPSQTRDVSGRLL